MKELLILFALAVIANQLTWQHQLLNTPRKWIVSRVPSWLAEGMQCPVCVAWWIGLAAAFVPESGPLAHWHWPFVTSGLSYLYANL